jgi:hypothetical protein
LAVVLSQKATQLREWTNSVEVRFAYDAIVYQIEEACERNGRFVTESGRRASGGPRAEKSAHGRRTRR